MEAGLQDGTAGSGQRVVPGGWAWCWGVLGSAGGCGVSTVLKLVFTCTQARAVVCTSTCAAGGVRWRTLGSGWGPHGTCSVLLSGSRGTSVHLTKFFAFVCYKVLWFAFGWNRRVCPPPHFYCRSRKFLHILRENPSQSLASGHFLPGLGAWFGNRCSVWPEICSNGSDPTSRTSKERNFFCSVPVQVWLKLFSRILSTDFIFIKPNKRAHHFFALNLSLLKFSKAVWVCPQLTLVYELKTSVNPAGILPQARIPGRMNLHVVLSSS